MGLKRRNPARMRLVPEVLAVIAAPAVRGAEVQAKPRPAEPPPPAPLPRVISREERHQMIAKAAYGRAERSGFASDPLVNWLSAEREIDAEIASVAS